MLKLHTPRLDLTLCGVQDAEAVAAYVARNRVHHAPWEPPRPDGFETPEFWLRQLAQNQVDFDEGRTLRLFLQPSGSDAVIGATNFTNIARGPLQACILGYGIDHAYEGRGLMREALEHGIAYVFGTLGLHRIEANYLPTNARSGGLLRRLGFQVEGYARDYLYINGAWRDHIRSALTNPDPERVHVPNTRVEEPG